MKIHDMETGTTVETTPEDFMKHIKSNIDEYKIESERKDYLDAQNAELEEALNTLKTAIQKIDRETRTRFKETFELVNKHIQELFPKLFGGGHAYLEMTGDDLLDTGVTLMARPPGKKNASIQLLSGGEKALTAIAMVFAIFRLNPAPFCMLDEVDAPLDDANVGQDLLVDDANVGHNRLRTWHEEDVVAVAAGNNTTIK